MYSQVIDSAALGVDTHVVCERVENLDQFSVENIHMLDRSPASRAIWHRILYRLRLRTNPGFIGSHGLRLSPDVVHSHFGQTGVANLAALRTLKAQHIVTFYGYDVS